uniref:Uncharacterized protein n=1 Tax=Gopherus agassizii TaxID=38772 RepID=A0A452IET3_9SAUR
MTVLERIQGRSLSYLLSVFICSRVIRAYAHSLVFKSAHIFTNTPLSLCYLYYWYYFVIYFSGGHINPAVSLAMCATGRLKWTKLPFYILAQFLGAFVGAAAVFGIYYDAFMNYSGGELIVTGSNATAHIFATYPAPHLSLISGFADQVISTALLVLVVFAIFDTKNLGVPKGLEPIAVGLLILLLTCSLGMNSGCAMNPARDLSPRIFTAIAGWGFEVFTAGNNWWWVPTIAPMMGGVIGAFTYIIFIEIHHSDTHLEEDTDMYEKYELSNMEKEENLRSAPCSDLKQNDYIGHSANTVCLN